MKGNSFLKSVKIFAILILAGLSSSSAFAQTRSISGTVVDNQNVPIIGASPQRRRSKKRSGSE